MRILVVEDEADLRRQLADALTHAGYAVDLAADGEDGHFLGDTEPYDAVILDLGLPKMDGVTILERWREDGKTFPVMILTARDRWSEKVEGRHETFVANTIAEIAEVFPDHELILSLGCESCINIPVVIGGQVAGTLNCLHEAGHYTPERVAASEQLKLPGAVAFLLLASMNKGE